MTLQKDGPKRRRRTRRDCRANGGLGDEYRRSHQHFKAEREAAQLRAYDLGNNFNPITGQQGA